MTKTGDSHTDSENSDVPQPPEFPSVIVNRGLLGIPDVLAFWRRKKSTSS